MPVQKNEPDVDRTMEAFRVAIPDHDIVVPNPPAVEPSSAVESSEPQSAWSLFETAQEIVPEWIVESVTDSGQLVLLTCLTALLCFAGLEAGRKAFKEDKMSILGIGKLLCTLLVLYWGWFAASGFVDASSSTIAWATSVGVGFFCLRLLAEVGLTILGLLTIARNAGRKLVRGATGEWWAYARNYRKRQREESSSEPNEVGAAEEA